ncbi:glycosyltransferase family 2 protein [Thalassotalea sp. PLHSN55]|uniref:glycosyltransferase family 2 protein n=1 Tax=Thalassotalea sp. PLHSN55 TaxID=3435888 RepID=UPI003F87C9BB
MKISTIPVVSVVIPMFNVEKYIEQSIRSVLAQSYSHFELILVDDGCTDNTLALIEQFDDFRIRVIKQANRGLSGARNTGIDAARGIYVALLDADDYWAPEKLAVHIKHLNNNPKVGISYSPSLFVDDDSVLLGIGQYPKLKNVSCADIFCRNPIGNGSAPVIRRSLLTDISYFGQGRDKYRKMYFNENLRQSEDIELWTRIALTTQWKFEGVKQALTYYRVNEGGLSANLGKQFASWQHAVSLNRVNAPRFFKKYYQLAKAYQLRYLARRAVQSSHKFTALKLVHQALICDVRILLHEPSRTFLTLASAWLKLLPNALYLRIEKLAMENLGQRKIS